MTPEEAKGIGAFIATALNYPLPPDTQLEASVRYFAKLPEVRLRLRSDATPYNVEITTSAHSMALAAFGPEGLATMVMADLKSVWENHYDTACDH